MTQKELRRLRRRDLLELLLKQTMYSEDLEKQLAETKEELQKAKDALNDKTIRVENAGSIAEASLQLNEVFKAAQDSADQYLETIKNRMAESETKIALNEETSGKKCEDMLRDATEKSETLVADATVKSEALVADATAKSDMLIADATAKSDALVADASAKSQEMIAKAEKKSAAYWSEVQKKLDSYYESHKGLREILNISIEKLVQEAPAKEQEEP